MSSKDTQQLAFPSVETPKLVFHPLYADKKSGSIILQADDDRKFCFYFNLSLLSAISSFFAKLPSPSSSDCHDGTPFIPLIGSTSSGLYVFLHAIRSLTSSAFFNSTNCHSMTESQYHEALIDAAVIGKMYLVPIIPRLLYEALQKSRCMGEEDTEVLEFAIWALSDNIDMISASAEATLGCLISRTPRYISDTVKRHALNLWLQLLELHIRSTEGLNRFRLIPWIWTKPMCENRHCPSSSRTALQDAINGACGAEAIRAAIDGKQGALCWTCVSTAKLHYVPKLEWLVRFTTKFYLSAEDENFKGC